MNEIRAYLKKPKFCFDNKYFSQMIKPEMIALINFQSKYMRLKKEYGEYDFKFSECELMQYAGFKDKNGNDVYEGDIIDIHQTVNGQNLFIITFQDLKVMPTYLWGDNYEYDILELLDYYCHPDEIEIEVVGNIYENPELLKVKK